MTPDDLKRRTKAFALDVIELSRRLPVAEPSSLLGRQLIRAGTSVGANYRAVCRPKSDADFISKLGIVIEECDEAAFWLELLVDAGCLSSARALRLTKEADELTRRIKKEAVGFLRQPLWSCGLRATVRSAYLALVDVTAL